MDGIKSWFEQENSRLEKILASPEKLEETLSKRLDADKLVFSPKLNPLQANALQSIQTADAIRLQQLHQANSQSGSGHRQKTPGARDYRERQPPCFATDARSQAKSGARGGEDCDDNRTPFHPRHAKEALSTQAAISRGTQAVFPTIWLRGLLESQRLRSVFVAGAIPLGERELCCFFWRDAC
jgi:hypothetical protein